MGLFVEALDREIAELHANACACASSATASGSSVRLQAQHRRRRGSAPRATTGLKLQIAVSYGGRWDIVQAAQQLAAQCASGALRPAGDRRGRASRAALQLAGLPDADLLIRTGGEQRISNFLLWNLAYAELYFSDRLWPDFDRAELEAALAFFAGRERRFGLTAAAQATESRERRVTRVAAQARSSPPPCSIALLLVVLLWLPPVATVVGADRAGAAGRVGVVGVPARATVRAHAAAYVALVARAAAGCVALHCARRRARGCCSPRRCCGGCVALLWIIVRAAARGALVGRRWPGCSRWCRRGSRSSRLRLDLPHGARVGAVRAGARVGADIGAYFCRPPLRPHAAGSRGLARQDLGGRARRHRR